jgi:hypothetical protein
MMHNDIEQLLSGLSPRGVSPELRPRVLAATQRQLIEEPAAPWLWRSALAVAAALLVGIAMNVGASTMAERNMAKLFGPPPVPKQVLELARDVERVAGADAAQSVLQQFTKRHPSRDGHAAYMAYADVLRQLSDGSSINPRESDHETPEENPQMDRNHSARPRGDRTDCQRGVRLDYRYTA